MKQKNLILMVVAVGCGLLAAFLTSQMSAKPAAGPQLTEVLVPVKELAGGTKFTADSIKDQFKKRMVNPEFIPEKAIITEDMLVEKTLNKTIRADGFILESDLGNYISLQPPEGRHVVTVRLAVDKMTPFVQPNSRIDLMGTLLTKDGKVKSGILIPNMIIMAIDAKAQMPNGNALGDMAIQLATLAATREEAQAIRACEHANVKLSFILRSESGNTVIEDEGDKEWSYDKVVAWVNNDDEQAPKADEKPTEAPPVPEKPPEATVKMTVPTADLPAGTELTNEVVQSKFKEVPVVGAAPAGAVLNIKDHVGRFLIKDVAAEQFVPKTYIKDAMPQVAAAPRKDSENAPTPKTKPDVPEAAPVKKLPTFDRFHVSAKGTKVFRFEIADNGDLKFLGEVVGGALVPASSEKADEPAERKES